MRRRIHIVQARWKSVVRAGLFAMLLASIAAPSAFLQTAAWVTMAVNYSVKEGSVVEGLSKTFDGEHPCKLCLAAANEAARSGDSDPAEDGNTPLKVHWSITTASMMLYPPSCAEEGWERQDEPLDGSTSTEHPPPRAGGAFPRHS